MNLSMLIDFYEFTMSNSIFENNMHNTIAYFDMYFRKNPDAGGYSIIAGVDELINYLSEFKFKKDDIEYLASLNVFSKQFLEFLSEFKFTCDVWAVPEGTPVFPKEPLIIVKGRVIEAMLIETLCLLTVNHQSLIATKSRRIKEVAKGRSILEMGSRRAHGVSAAIQGARAAYIAGIDATSCTVAGKKYGIPVQGTMAHSFVQMFDNEMDAFNTYANTYPDNCVLLIDTYNVLKSGLPNAIKVFKRLQENGHDSFGIRIDSGDIAYLSKKCRKALDEAGLQNCKIIASNSLDEVIINSLIEQGAKVDIFGVGENLITSKSEPTFGGVYKLVAIENENKIIPKIKISENTEKITIPGFKKVYRIYDKETNMAISDVITMHDETIDESQPYILFDPIHIWKKKEIKDYYIKNLHVQIFDKGVCVYEKRDINVIRKSCEEQVNLLWKEVKRIKFPHKYHVNLSKEVWKLKNDLLENNTIT